MGNYPAYPEYKESAIDWLGKIPAHWVTKRLKNIATYNDESLGENTEPDYELEYVDISSVNLVEGITSIENMTFEKAPSRARRKVRDVDTIVSTVRTYLKAIASIRNPPANLIVSTGFAVIRPKQGLEPEYVGYLLQSEGFVGEVVANSTGVSYPAINASVLATLPVIEPPLAEQQAIARFLDRKTAQIDALIAKKEALLARLAEKRTALISQAVTRGLDPTVPMKDSGIPWLGEIPAHWDTCSIKRVAQISYGVGGEIDRGLVEGTNLLSLPNVTKDGTLLLDEVPLCELSDVDKKDALLKKGDLLFNWRNGSSQHLGKTAYFDLDGEWTHVSFLLKLRFEQSTSDPRYFQYMMTGLRITGFFATSKAGVNNTFNLNELANLWITNPPKNDQQAIADFLDVETLRNDRMALEVKRAIAKLQEYRTALITAAVTGKIDVRSLPEASPPILPEMEAVL